MRGTLIGCFVAVSFCFCAFSFAELKEPTGVNLADLNGWTIVIPEKASPSVQYAAQEFQQFFNQASGLKLPIEARSEKTRPDRHIHIGRSSLTTFFLPAIDSNAGSEDFGIMIQPDNIVIAGGEPRGTLYGVYTFLEDYLGVRFLTPDHTFIPKIGPWRIISPVQRFCHPPLGFRWSFYWETNHDPVFAARLRTNTVATDPKLGGKTPNELINHTFYNLLPVSQYGKDHPEYFALINGKRRAQGETQPCLTNPEVLKIVTRAVLAKLDAEPGRTNISVSQNDNDKYCRCPNCAAIDQREGTPMGSLLTFVNAVAGEVAKKHPNVKVGTLSYWYTRKPPKTLRPRPNVQIQLCSIECCTIHPIDDPKCPKNVEFCHDMADWGKICQDISIWNYDTNFSNYQLPFPNFRSIEPNIRYFVANNAKGVFMQAAYTTPAAEFSDLRNYVMGNLLWDPNRSARALMDEFITLHYGRAADPIRHYLNRLHDHAWSAGVHPNCFGQAKDFADDDPAIVQAGLTAFAEAMRLAENDTIRARVEKASICVYRAAIEPIWEGKATPAQVRTLRPLAQKFFQLARKYGVTNVSEGGTLDDAEKRIHLD